MTISTPPLDVDAHAAPRAPTQAAWDAMSPAERAQAAAALPTYIPNEELGTMDGQTHQIARDGFEGALRTFSEATGQPMFVGGVLAVYYPGERRIQPDVFVVTGVEQRVRESWVVSQEERPLEFVLEILVQGHREKDLRDNVVRYAQLGIREYFLADMRRRRLYAWRLNDPGVRIYTPLVPQLGRIRSAVLGLDVKLEGNRVRLYHGNAPLLEPAEIAERLRDELNDEQMRHQETLERVVEAEGARRAAEEARRAAEEARRAAEAEKRAADARADAAEAELARLRAMLERRKPG